MTEQDTKTLPETGINTESSVRAKASSHDEKATKSAAKRRLKAPLSKLAILAILLALLSVLASAYVYWLNDQSRLHVQETNNKNVLLNKRLSQLSVALEEQTQHNQRLNRALQEVQSQVGHNLAANNALNKRFLELAHTDRSDWQLAEVEYLLRLAHQRVVSNNNAGLGLELLLAADELLRDMGSADLFAVRQQIAEDVQALKTTVSVDVEGLYVNLSALIDGIDLLDFGSVPELEEDSTIEQNLSIQNVWESLLSLYRVTPREGVIEPLLTNEQRFAIQQRVKLLISQSRQAVITSSEDIYIASLSEAQDIVQRYANNEERKDVLLEQINDYMSQRIKVDLPDISSSHAKMSDYISALRLQYLAKPQDGKE